MFKITQPGHLFKKNKIEIKISTGPCRSYLTTKNQATTFSESSKYDPEE